MRTAQRRKFHLLLISGKLRTLTATLRPIRKEDDPFIRDIITSVMTEFNADPKTTVLGDPSIHKMFDTYQVPGGSYFVAVEDGKIIGGCGIRQLDGSTQSICELQRMFLLPETRGKGIGKALIEKCIAAAREEGFDQMYLESLSQMTSAIALYKKTGFRLIDKSLGNTGHGGCNVFMILDL
jgi:putative acetyltransferase